MNKKMKRNWRSGGRDFRMWSQMFLWGIAVLSGPAAQAAQPQEFVINLATNVVTSSCDIEVDNGGVIDLGEVNGNDFAPNGVWMVSNGFVSAIEKISVPLRLVCASGLSPGENLYLTIPDSYTDRSNRRYSFITTQRPDGEEGPGVLLLDGNNSFNLLDADSVRLIEQTSGVPSGGECSTGNSAQAWCLDVRKKTDSGSRVVYDIPLDVGLFVDVDNERRRRAQLMPGPFSTVVVLSTEYR
ncbi:hypothetical protein HX362_004641 [Salmonella enterica]|nr:hypothetical protein [Salmonella enterica]